MVYGFRTKALESVTFGVYHVWGYAHTDNVLHMELGVYKSVYKFLVKTPNRQLVVVYSWLCIIRPSHVCNSRIPHMFSFACVWCTFRVDFAIKVLCTWLLRSNSFTLKTVSPRIGWKCVMLLFTHCLCVSLHNGSTSVRFLCESWRRKRYDHPAQRGLTRRQCQWECTEPK